MGNLYGYIRVSTREQNEDRQILALKELSIPEKNLFIDKQSGKDFERPQYRKMVHHLVGGCLSVSAWIYEVYGNGRTAGEIKAACGGSRRGIYCRA